MTEYICTAINRNKYKTAIGVLLILIGIVILFSNRLYYSGFSADENYQALCVRDYKNSPLAIGVFYLGHLWTDVWGFSLLSLRLLCRACFLFSITVGTSFLFNQTKNFLLAASTFLICCISTDLGCFSFYNWDTGAYPFETIGVLAFIAYIRKQNICRTIILGCACGIMATARIPLLSTFILAIPLIIYCRDKKVCSCAHLFYQIFIVFISMALTVSSSYLFITGSLHELKECLSLNNVITGHGIDFRNFISTYIWRTEAFLPMVILSMIPITSCFIGAIAIYMNNKTRIWLICISICFIINWSILRINALCHDTYIPPLFGIGLSLPLILSFIPFSSYTKWLGSNENISKYSTTNRLRIQMLCYCGLIFLWGVGSDTPFQRWDSPVIIPFVIATAWNSFGHRFNDLCKSWFSLIIITLIPIVLYRSYAIRDEFEWLSISLPYRSNIPVMAEESDAWKDINEYANSFDSQGLNYTFWGDLRYPMSISYESKPKFSIQQYHFSYSDISSQIPNLNELDYIFLTSPAGDIRDKAIKSLSEHDFSIVKSKHSYALMKNNHSNGNNRYN